MKNVEHMRLWLVADRLYIKHCERTFKNKGGESPSLAKQSNQTIAYWAQQAADAIEAVEHEQS